MTTGALQMEREGVEVDLGVAVRECEGRWRAGDHQRMRRRRRRSSFE